MQQHLGENMVEITHRLSQNKLNQEPSCHHPWQLHQCVNTSVGSCFREALMSACLEMCLDSECIALNPLALFKAFCFDIHADYLEKLAFLLPYFYRFHLIWKGGGGGEGCLCGFFISIFHSGWWRRKAFDSRMRSLLVVVSLLPPLQVHWKTGSKTGILVQRYSNSEFCM